MAILKVIATMRASLVWSGTGCSDRCVTLVLPRHIARLF